MKHTWVSFLPKVVESLNNTPLKRLGWLTPNSIHNEASSVLVRNEKKKHNILENELLFTFKKLTKKYEPLYKKRLVVPEILIPSVLELYYDCIAGGPLGECKTWKKV